jgi:Tol biopolymer transport system component
MFRPRRLSAGSLLLAIAAFSGIVPTLKAAPLTIDRLMQIKHPSSPTPSPDGKYLAFVWDERGVWNLYLVSTSGGTTAPEKLTTFASGQVSDPFWSPDGNAIFFPHAGELWKVDIANGNAASAARNTAVRGSGFAPSPDGQQLAFVQSSKGQGADLLVSPLNGGSAKRVAHNDTNIGALSWSPDGKHILYTGGTKTIRHEQTPEYSGAKIIYTITERAGGTQLVASTGGGEPIALQGPGGFGGARWVDPTHVVFDRTSKDFKKRSTYLADASAGSVRVITKTRTIDFGAFRAARERLRNPRQTANGSCSSAIGMVGITCT